MTSDTLMNDKKEYFKKISNDIFGELQSDEKLTLNLHAEDSEFIRFNKAKVRQASQIEQLEISYQLFKGSKNSSSMIQLSGDYEQDIQLAKHFLEDIRIQTKQLPDDPFCILPTNNGNSDESFSGEHPQGEDLLSKLFAKTADLDFVGIYQAGPVANGNANSEGQFHWFSNNSFAVDYSLFAANENAVKGTYAGKNWSDDDFAAQIAKSGVHLEMMSKPSQKIQRGEYRTFLAPAAVAELLNTTAWGAFSYKALKTGGCPFEKLQQQEVSLSAKLQISENFEMGLTPRFNELGEVSPLNLPLVGEGLLKNMLISSKTAKEFSLETNFSGADESPRALDMGCGDLQEQDILARLGTGLYLSNLHYLNWSDRASARITGMTRYACFWVENGEIVSPIEDLRFDVSLYDIWGSQLMDLTQAKETMAELTTYYKRHIGGCRAPGMLIDGYKFTL